MAKKKAGRPKGERDDVSVKIARNLAKMLNRLADHRGEPVAEVLSNLGEAPIKRAYAQMLRDLDSEETAE